MVEQLTKPTDLQPGDCLLYFSRDWVDRIIALKTWTHVAHVEIYAGDGQSYASRNGIGVGLYPYRKEGLVYQLRANRALNVDSARKWFFDNAIGQKYDWLGLLCFFLAARQGSKTKMFCSEFATRYYRAAGLDLFNPSWDADRVPPSFFLVTPLLNIVWP